VSSALLVADEYVPERGGQQRIVGRQDRAARETKDYLDALLLETADECLGSGELLHD
jgi:hypothetical protein